jgi:hypothetical protein
MLTQVRQQVRRFYDGGVPPRGADPGSAPDPGDDPRIVLDRHSENGVEQFALQRRIAYLDRHLGELLVPADPDTFRTDLTSVPALFTWLVPKTGAHLPAALLHDGLVHPPGHPTYVSTDGHVVDRVEADRVFRDAMADTGTGVVRRWLVWAAVATATILGGAGTTWSRALLWRYRSAAGLTVALVAYLGFCATVDLFDLTVPGAVALPWMGDRSWPLELVGGLAGAVVVPLLLGLTWGRFRIAGTIVGIGLAVLLHVTLALLGLTALYQAVEWTAARRPMVVAVVAALALVLATGLVVALSTGSA